VLSVVGDAIDKEESLGRGDVDQDHEGDLDLGRPRIQLAASWKLTTKANDITHFSLIGRSIYCEPLFDFELHTDLGAMVEAV